MNRVRAAAAVLVLAVVLGGCTALYRSGLFPIRRVEVDGAARLTAQGVRALAAIPADATLVRFPADAVAARVAADPWVRAVTVSRLFPDGMRIRIVERVPLVAVVVGRGSWLVDATGMVIAQSTAEDTGGVIVVRDVPGLDPKAGRRTTSEPLLNAIAVLNALSEPLLSQIVSVSARTVDGTSLYTRDRIEIVFGSVEDASTKDKLVLNIMDQMRGRVVSIDVRTIDHPTAQGL